MSPQQTLRNIINKSCPELLKLEFGCEIKFKKPFLCEGGLSPFVYTKVIDSIQSENKIFIDGVQKIIAVKKEDIEEILGKPPTLEHLLRTLPSKYYIRQDGTIFEWEKFTDGNGHHGVKSTYITLDLTLPPLDQPEETIIRLVEILS